MRVSIVIPCYNAEDWILRCLDSLKDLASTGNIQVSIVVVDDGSTDDTRALVASSRIENVQLVPLSPNKGRSSARNAGASAIESDVIVFIDADCIAVGGDFLLQHVSAIDSGADVSFGDVHTPGFDFWAKVQQNAAASRRALARGGEPWVFTTANVAIRTSKFLEAGGFDPVFDRFGFEDRDLFLRLLENGATAHFNESAAVIHLGNLSLARMCRSFLSAGQMSSREFRQRHPRAYEKLSFRRLDAGLNPWLYWLDRLSWPIVRALAHTPENWLEKTWMPFGVRLAFARYVYGLHYMHGTILANRSTAT